MEHINMKSSLHSKLQINSICSIRIRSKNLDIIENHTLVPKNPVKMFEVERQKNFFREIRSQIHAIRDLPQKDKFRAYATTKMLDKLYK